MVCQASMKKQIRISLRNTLSLGVALPMLLVLLSACTLPRLNVATDAVLYIPEVVQGNFVSREQKEFLKPGMSRMQVREVLGTPLVSSVFHEQRWDYVFTIRRQGVPAQSFNLNVWFKGDVLERVTGDELPSETEFVTKLVAKKSSTKVPDLEAKEEDLRKFPAPVRKADPAPTTALPLPSSYPPLEPAKR
jgi:outer membrane protein assembly factor BamE